MSRSRHAVARFGPFRMNVSNSSGAQLVHRTTVSEIRQTGNALAA
jgi:hypothetical protein